MRHVAFIAAGSVPDVLSGPLAAVLAVAVLVFIHEFGHFIVAKACGVGVTTFSLGFGRRVLGFEWRGTDYRLSLIPFGGYVALAGAEPFSYDVNPDDPVGPEEGAFHARPVWQRLLVIGAGPAMNLVLPVFVFTALLMAGEPRPSTEIGAIATDGLAAQAGVEPGDRIVSIDGGPELRTFTELAEALVALDAGTHGLSVERDGRPVSLTLDLPAGGGAEHPIGVTPSRPSARIGVDDPSSPAGRAGLRSGDTVLRVADQEVRDWLEVQDALAAVDAGSGVRLRVVDADGAEREVELEGDSNWTAAAAFPASAASQRWGLLPASLFVDAVCPQAAKPSSGGLLAGCAPPAPTSPADAACPAGAAGMLAGDRLLRIDGEPVIAWSDVLRLVKASMEGEGEQASARPIDLEVSRDGQVVALTMTPEVFEDTDSFGRYYWRPVIGVASMGGYTMGPEVRVRYAFGPAVVRAVDETAMAARFVLNTLGSMLTREVDVKQSVGGPVEIFRQASAAAERGIFDYARLLAGLSISLGIVNLLPVPVLDGGQLLFFFLEAVRGRPVSVVLRERAQQLGVLFMVLLMLTVLVWDIQRALGG